MLHHCIITKMPSRVTLDSTRRATRTLARQLHVGALECHLRWRSCLFVCQLSHHGCRPGRSVRRVGPRGCDCPEGDQGVRHHIHRCCRSVCAIRIRVPPVRVRTTNAKGWQLGVHRVLPPILVRYACLVFHPAVTCECATNTTPAHCLLPRPCLLQQFWRWRRARVVAGYPGPPVSGRRRFRHEVRDRHLLR